MRNILPIAAGLAVSLTSLGAYANEDKAPATEAAPAVAAQPKHPTPDLLKERTLYVVGYAHLDTQWRWTYADSIREYIPKTLDDNFRLIDKYPSYIFNFSGSRRYRMMQEYYPEKYAKLKSYVAAGRWFPCGSSVDENDANVPSAESFVRHILYGNKFFRKEFGVVSEEFMLPDCFGFPAAMPTILSHCGLKGFSTQKLTWNAVVPIPFKVGVWEGPDGQSVTAAFDPGAYVGEVRENLANSNAWKARIDASGKVSGVLADYHYFGTGDTGGAPTEKSVEMVEKSVGTKGDIKVISSNADQLFKDITPDLKAKLPKYKGELMLTEHSAGSITSQATMKRWNRKNEQLADAAERASLAAWWLGARPYPSTKIEDAWYLLLGSQMHDILPGTSLPKAYEYSWNDEALAANQFQHVLVDAASSVIASMDTRASGQSIVVYNPLSTAREDVVEIEVTATAAAKGAKVTGPDGKQVPAQVLSLANGIAKVAFVAKVSPVSFSTFGVELTADVPAASAALKVQSNQLENEYYVVKVNASGDVSSIFDKRAKKELLASPMRLGLHYENPRQWPAWNQDWADRKLEPKSFAGGAATMKVIENGPARVAIEVTQEAEGSKFVQHIRLSAGESGSRVEFVTDIDWHSRERSLRVHFPLTVSNPKASYDLAAGVLERGNGHEKQYEYSFHQWFDLTDSKKDYGVSAMCDSKYGADKPNDNTVRLTLLHTPGVQGGYPDQATQDIGKHRVTYALYGHAGEWQAAQGHNQAAQLNQPMIAFSAQGHEGPLGKSYSLMRVSDSKVSISAAKKAEEGDEVIVRLREHTGSEAKGVKVSFSQPVISAREVDGQEREIGKATVTDGALVTDVHGFGLRAFAVKLGKAAAASPAVASTPIAIPFDTDVIATAAKPTDGAMNGSGDTFPASMLPKSLTAEGVPFTLGSGDDGQKNALSCNGQEIKLPEGGFDRLYLLAAADGDTAATIEIDGKSMPWNVQSWNGYIGQWDNRLWPTSVTESAPGDGGIVGIVPGYVKNDSVAWFATHYLTPKGNTFYEFSYIFKYAIDLPAGAKSVKLPKNSKIKVFAASAAKNSGGGVSKITPARPLFDTLSDHTQDGPRISPVAGQFKDATDVRVEPGLYWRPGAIRFTTDGSEPTLQSPVYTGPLPLNKSATIKAAAVGADGKLSPVASANIEVNDTTAPSIKRVSAVYQSTQLTLEFSEPLGDSAGKAGNYTITPAIGVTKAELQADRRRVVLTLAKAPEMNTKHQVHVSGVQDNSPAANAISGGVAEFLVAGPVYTLEAMTPEQRGTTIKDVKGLPTKARDAWTINMFVRPDKPIANRTLIAGFGSIADRAGQARYLAKFGGGAHFWSSNRDVTTQTQIEPNHWQMMTITYDGSTLRVFKDGKKIGEGTPALADDEATISLAPKDPWEHQRQFSGDIRKFTVWSGALGDDAMASLLKDMPK